MFSIRSAFFEALFVVFGVILALAANEWRQNVKAEELADAALASVITELETNQVLISSSMQYHESQVKKLQDLMSSKKTPTMNDYPKGFINPAWVTDTAWAVAKETGVLADMDYQTVLTLSATYERLDRYRRQSEMAGQLVYEAIFEKGSSSLAAKPVNMMTILYTFIYREKQLEESLVDALGSIQIFALPSG
ncbi:MAG: hypothetical protein GY780_05920 [bacterium]|nr:hypothetical protein [bacterium]